MICYKIINKNENYDTKNVSSNIASNKTLGRMGYSSIQYWIDEIWKGKTWEDFVKINFLEDMVDKELRPIPFELSGEEVKQGKLKNIYLNNIKRIICRGYRITNKGKFNKTIINKIYNELGID